MLIPSDFPSWLRWTYNISFHTYAWRTFMYSEFIEYETLDSTQFPSGMAVLEAYEIGDINRGNDVSCCWYASYWRGGFGAWLTFNLPYLSSDVGLGNVRSRDPPHQFGSCHATVQLVQIQVEGPYVDRPPYSFGQNPPLYPKAHCMSQIHRKRQEYAL